jgi:Pyridoxamine 5'-phosphate oxidase
MASWGEFAAAEPEFAERVLERFTLRKHSTLATLRHDGSPRISGTEVSFDGGELWLGMMPRSLKARDLQRDARLALHSPTEDTPEEDPGSWAGEAKVAGRGLENSDPSRRDEGHRFRVEITEVSDPGRRAGRSPRDRIVAPGPGDRTAIASLRTERSIRAAAIAPD